MCDEKKSKKQLIEELHELRRQIAQYQTQSAEYKHAEEVYQEDLAKLAQKNRHEAIISAVTRSVHQSIDLEQVFENAVEAISSNVEGVDYIAIYLVEGEELVIKAHIGFPDWFIERAGSIPRPKGFTWKTILEGKPRYVADVDEDKSIGPAGREVGIQSYLTVPVRSGDRTVGCLAINSRQKDAFDKDELKLLEIVARQIEIAIQNAQQADALRQSEKALKANLELLSKKNRHEAIINAVTRSVHQSIDLEQVFENAADAMSENIDSAQYIAIYMVEGEEAVMKAHRGHPDWFIERVERIPYPKGFTWKTILEGKPRYVPDVDEDKAIGPAGRDAGFQSYLSVPIKHENKTVGSINIVSFEKEGFEEDELKLLEIVARQIEMALQNAKQAEALEQSEERYRILFEQAPLGVFIFDKELKIIQCNKRIAEILKTSSDKLIGFDMNKLQNQSLISAMKSVFDDKPSFHEGFHKATTGTAESWLSAHYTPLHDSGGNVTYGMGVMEDVSERKQAEEALRESEEKFRSIGELALSAVIMSDENGNVIYWNKAATQIFGYEEDEIMGKDFHALILPERYAQAFHKGFSEFQETGRGEIIGTAYEIEAVHKDGHEFPVELSISALKHKGKWHSIGFVRDITERRNSIERLKEQAALLDKAHDAILVLDLEHRIIFTNESALRLYGWTGEDILGKKFEEEVSFLLKEPIEVVAEKGEWSGELPQVTRDGREIQVESRWTLVCDDEGKPKSILVINTDITEKKKLEAQFLRAQRMENLGVLAGGIAHDFNNLLQPIMLSLQILKSRFDDEKSQELVKVLQSSADRGAGLVKQILSFARGEQARNDTLQVGYIVSEVEKVLKETFPKLIEIRTDMPKDLWTVSGDPTQLQQVIMNLCVNARDAMPEGGKLTVSGKNLIIDKCMARFNIAAEPGPYILLTISDTGVGIPPEIIDRIFDPFFSTKELGENTGLGLSTAFTIVKNHGGFINVYSELGRGTIFKVYLPANETLDTVEEAMKDGVDEPQKGRGELILVVDDEAVIREITKAVLEANGYRVVTANNGSEALGTYTDKKDEIEAVILDLIMPVMGGVAAFQALRKLNPEVKVIVATGFGDRSKLGGINDKEVGAFLWKPFTAETLLGTLREVLE